MKQCCSVAALFLSACVEVLALEPAMLSGACISDDDCAPEETCQLAGCVSVACTPSERRCNLLSREECGVDRRWHTVSATCTERCASGSCKPARSCQFASMCGEREDYSCCEAHGIMGGKFSLPDDPSVERVDGPVERSVSPFMLDRFEVTVGRFRNYLLAYEDIGPPKAGDGSHPNIPGSGWQAEWNERRVLPSSARALEITLTGCGQKTDGSVDDNLPVRCINWYTAFAFCIWDGGRLPTEAEWSFAAMGGDEQRLYPWSSSDQAIDISAQMACYSEDRWEDEVGDQTEPDVVASHASGAGKFGTEDMAGNLWEWIADGYRHELQRGPCRTDPASALITTLDCQELESVDLRVQKGGSYVNGTDTLKNRTRSFAEPSQRDPTYGFRCARSMGTEMEQHNPQFEE